MMMRARGLGGVAVALVAVAVVAVLTVVGPVISVRAAPGSIRIRADYLQDSVNGSCTQTMAMTGSSNETVMTGPTCNVRAAMRLCQNATLASSSACVVALGNGTHWLTQGEIFVANGSVPMQVTGQGRNATWIAGEHNNGGERFLRVEELASGLELADVALRGFSSDSAGGAVLLQACSGRVALRRVRILDCSAHTNGGGLAIGSNNSHVEVLDSEFRGNTASTSSGNGGGVWVDTFNNDVQFEGTVWAGNTAFNGGGLYVGENNLRLSVSACRWAGNTAYGTGGGGVFVQNSNLNSSWQDSAFDSNMATSSGGALYMNEDNDLAHFSNMTVRNNTAARGGGFLVVRTNLNMTFDAVRWIDNTASDQAGAILLHQRNHGATFTDCLWDANAAATSGGAVWVHQLHQRVRFLNCTWRSNAANFDGGGVYSSQFNDRVEFQSCTFVRNHADYGAALFAFYFNDHTLFRNCSFADNSVLDQGGDIYLHKSNVGTRIESCAFSNSFAGVAGGSLFLSATNTDVTISDCSFTSCLATSGAVAGLDNENGRVLWERCEFVHNHATTAGGVLQLGQGNHDVTVRSSRATNNSAAREGGFMYLGSANSRVTVQESELCHNRAGDTGGAIASALSTTVSTLEHTLICGNEATDTGALAFGEADQWLISNCTFENNTSWDGNGGAVAVEEADLLVVESTVFAGNAAAVGYGGALHILGGGSGDLVLLQNVTAVSNLAQQCGGAVSVADDATMYLVGSQLMWNNASQSGGALYSIDSTLSLTGLPDSDAASVAAVFPNVSLLGGGGSFAGINASAANQLVENAALENGGAIGTESSALRISGCDLLRNSAGTAGGAVFAQGSRATIREAQAHGNRAEQTGGAVHLSAYSTLALSNSTVLNSSAPLGGGLYSDAQGQLRVVDTVFADCNGTYNGGGVFLRSPANVLRSVVMKRCTAPRGGGGGMFIDWTSSSHLGTVDDGVEFQGNTARYGPDIASPIFRLQSPLQLFADSGAATLGVNLTAADFWNQTVVGYDSSYAQVFISSASSGCASPKLAGSSVAEFSSDGVARFQNLGITCTPTSSVDARFIVSDTTLNIDLETTSHVSLSGCEIGEIVSKEVCTRCPQGTYAWNTSWPECRDCLKHAHCDGETGWKIDVNAGYWRGSNFSTRVRWCIAGEDACEGGSDPDDQCAKGSSGPLCLVCKDGYYQSSAQTRCRSCQSVSRFAPLVVLGSVVLFLVVGGVWVQWRHPNWMRRMNERLNKATSFRSYWKVVFAYAQIVAEYQSLFAADYPSAFLFVSSALGITTLGFSTLVAPACFAANYTFYDTLLSQTLGALALILFGVLVCGVRSLMLPSAEERKELWARAFEYLLFFAYIIFPGTSTTIVQAFPCDDDFDDGGSYLKADYSISCNSQQYRDYVVYASVMIVVFPVGIMALYAGTLWRHRHEICPNLDVILSDVRSGRVTSPTLQQLATDFEQAEQLLVPTHPHAAKRHEEAMYGMSRKLRSEHRNANENLKHLRFLFEAYKPEFWWFEICENVRRFMMSSCLVFFWAGTSAQVALAIAIAAVFLMFNSWIEPFMHGLANRVIAAVHWSLLFILFATLLVSTKTAGSDGSTVGVLMIIAMVTGPVLPLFAIVAKPQSRLNRASMSGESTSAIAMKPMSDKHELGLGVPATYKSGSPSHRTNGLFPNAAASAAAPAGPPALPAATRDVTNPLIDGN